ncbi:MAG: CDP-alcohol phosphatidyltransferase family protein [Parachlamydiales bacterium]|nr:CDP-alcohol phosphatidyltransferase family protein [Parachlamydiales bacterium]
MRRIYLIPNVITAFGLACGLLVIFKVNMIQPGSGYYDVIRTSAYFLLLAGFADFVDGAVARILGAQSSFGVMFDSLADAVSFGVAPSVLVLKSLSLQQGTWFSFLMAGSAMIYSMSGVLRLVRFNVTQEAAKGNIIKEEAQKKHFTGLPIPAAAAAIVSLNLLFLSPFSPKISFTFSIGILAFVEIFIGYLMVSRWKFPSLKALHFRVAKFHLVFLTVLFAVFILYGFLYYFPIALALISWGYVLIGLILAIIRKIAGKRSKTLIDFEPDNDDVE